MATTVTPATLTVKITETIHLNGRDNGGETTLSVSDVNEIFKRIVSVPNSEVTLYETHDTNVAGATFDDDNVKYVRITNLDDTNYILLVIKNAGNDEAVYKLATGESFILHGHDTVFNSDNAAITDITAGLSSIDKVSARADTAAVDVEVFIASV